MAPRPGSQASLRAANVRRLLAAVRSRGVLSQAEIARTTGLSPASVSNIVRELIATGVVEVSAGIRSGRRAQVVRIRTDEGLVLGIDLGHQHVRVALADLRFSVLAERRRRFDVGAAAGEAFGLVERLAGEVLAEAGRQRAELRAAGVGLPAPMPVDGSVLASWPILPGWRTIDPHHDLARRLGVPVYADNDANIGARGELFFGAGRGIANLAYIKAATGLGAGLVVDGRVYRGHGGSAGEIGHLTIDETGPICSCGNRGCLETLVGGPYLLELLRHSHPDLRSVEDLVARAVEGDGGCRRVLGDAARNIGFVAASLCNVVNPERVVLGGDLALAGEIVLEPIRAAMARYAVLSVAGTPVVAAETADRAEVLGAVVLAAEHVLDPELGSGESRAPEDLLPTGTFSGNPAPGTAEFADATPQRTMTTDQNRSVNDDQTSSSHAAVGREPHRGPGSDDGRVEHSTPVLP